MCLLSTGVMYSMSALGPAVGFLMGAGFLKIFVNPWSAPADLSDTDTTWVGAWWMGFLLCGVLALFTGLPLLLFPRHLPSVEKVDVEDRPVMMTFVTSLKGKTRGVPKFTWGGGDFITFQDPEFRICSDHCTVHSH